MDTDTTASHNRLGGIPSDLLTKVDLLAFQLSLQRQMHRGEIMIYQWMLAMMLGMFIGFSAMFCAASHFLLLSVQASIAPSTASAAPSVRLFRRP
jgi:hypothetical protein